jgi:hypothetical protein
MIHDDNIQRAVSQILNRAERAPSIDKLISTFVDVGILARLENNNNQIIYGRRGTGKTHLFRILEDRLNNTTNNIAIWIDARKLGSSAQFLDPTYPIGMRCTSLFRDILTYIYNNLLENIVDRGQGSKGEQALEMLELFSKEAFDIKHTSSFHTTEECVNYSDEDKSSFKVSLATPAKSNLSIGFEKNAKQEEGRKTVKEYHSDDKIIFPAITDTISRILSLINCNLFILLDEWSSIPRDIQPYLAEFLKGRLSQIHASPSK